jgi:hypothetical protein
VFLQSGSEVPLRNTRRSLGTDLIVGIFGNSRSALDRGQGLVVSLVRDVCQARTHDPKEAA